MGMRARAAKTSSERIEMNRPNKPQTFPGFILFCLTLSILACTQCSKSTTLKGTWSCKAQWSSQHEGSTVPIVSQQEATCEDHVLSITGTITIGEATWSEVKESTCYASGDELYGEWTFIQTVPKNDAARKFEQERLAGKSLGNASNQVGQTHRVRVISRTDTQVKAVNEDGRAISCHRL